VNFRFEYPGILSFLALLPVLLGIIVFGNWLRRRQLGRFAHAAVLPRLTTSISRVRRALKTALLIMAMMMGVVALARPQYGFTEQRLPRKAVDVMIGIDTSASMLSQDFPPNRLQRAANELTALIHKLSGDRVGIIAFAGEAYLQCPLTTDYAIAEQVLETLTPQSVPVPGTAIARAIKLAEENFDKNEQGKKVLVLLTDGEDQGSDPVRAARDAAKKGIVIHAIGIGSESGAPIPLPEGGVKKDEEGHAVNSKMDFQTLKSIAAITGGVAIKARPAGYMELDRITQEISALEKRTLSETRKTVYQERFQWFLFPALLLVLIEMLIPERKPQGWITRENEGAEA